MAFRQAMVATYTCDLHARMHIYIYPQITNVLQTGQDKKKKNSTTNVELADYNNIVSSYPALKY